MLSADQHDIERLTYDYAFYNDTFNVDALVDLFVDDGVFDMTRIGLKKYVGTPAIRDFFEREKRALSHVIHMTTNHRIDVTGGTAVGTVYYHAAGIVLPDSVENQARGYYSDQYVKTESGWRFKSRTGNSLMPWEPITRRDV